jgi:8-oxo-dGTP diphosphatase
MGAVTRQGHQSPDGYDASAYPPFAVTVDVVILTMLDTRLNVLLVRRQADPYAGAWALPGGFKRPDETLDQAAARELREETGVVAPKHLAQFGAYGDPGRDPRTNVVTVAYLAVTPDVGAILAGSDADEARLWPVAEAIQNLDLAFDHRRILADAVDRAADQLEQTDLATAFVGPTFTLSELQNVYEQLWDADIDAANFRRSLTSAPPPAAGRTLSAPAAAGGPPPAPAAYVEPTGERAKSSARGGRPPELFKAGSAWKSLPPLRRPRKGSNRKPDST